MSNILHETEVEYMDTETHKKFTSQPAKLFHGSDV